MTTLIILVLLFNITAFLVPKKRTKLELYATALFGLLFAVLTDMFLATKYQLYWYFSGGVIWVWLIPLLGGKPAISVLFVNYYPLSSNLLRKLVYILAWSIILTLFELLLVYIGGILHYRTWVLWLSALLYPFILAILAANLHFTRHLMKRNQWF